VRDGTFPRKMQFLPSLPKWAKSWIPDMSWALYSGPQKSWPLLPCISCRNRGHDFCDLLYRRSWMSTFKLHLEKGWLKYLGLVFGSQIILSMQQQNICNDELCNFAYFWLLSFYVSTAKNCRWNNYLEISFDEESQVKWLVNSLWYKTQKVLKANYNDHSNQAIAALWFL